MMLLMMSPIVEFRIYDIVPDIITLYSVTM